MKKIIIGIAITCSTFFYYGCKDKTTPKENKGNNAFVGSWAGKSYTTDVESATEQTRSAGDAVTRATSYNLKSDGTFDEKVFDVESKGTWKYEADSSLFSLQYTANNGPNGRTGTNFNLVSVNDSLLVLKFVLVGYGTETYTFKKKK